MIETGKHSAFEGSMRNKDNQDAPSISPYCIGSNLHTVQTSALQSNLTVTYYRTTFYSIEDMKSILNLAL